MKNLVLLLFCTFIIACGNKKVEIKYDSGKIKESYHVDKQGKHHGVYLSYFENGSLKEESNYQAGHLSGMRKLFFEDGKVEIEEVYNSEGQLQGTYKVYYPTGQLQLEKEYKDNVIIGKIKVYYLDGKLKEEVTMENNEENGPFTEYYQNGAVHWKGSYRNGDNEYGLLEEFDSTGVILKKMMCDTLAICRTFWKQGMPESTLESQPQ
jgi:antitoxin component YwqK of YwqJK toxin-antitoxin module